MACTYQDYVTNPIPNARHTGTGILNLALSNVSDEYKKCGDIPQVPFSLATRGIIFRQRDIPYVVTLKNGDPASIVGDVD